jgi:hypothetical protein
MVAVPGLTAVIIPDEMPTVAIAELDDDQVPPAVVLDSVVGEPMHIMPEPVIAAGVGFTVSVVVL